MAAFRTRRKILFQHCDPAGIVFYPRYFELLNSVVEEWFEDGLGCGFDVFHRDRRRGIPTKHLDIEFHAPSRLGETIDFSYEIQRLGRAGITARIAVDCAGEHRFSGTQVLVHIDLDTGRPVPFPDDLRTAIARYAADEDAA